MLTDYRDIIEKIGEPIWYDEHGVPRYCVFEPKQCGVYITAAVLLAIECQSCGERSHVATVWNNTFPFMEQLRHAHEKGESNWNIGFQDKVPLEHAPSYGDPPRHNCSGGGDTMSSDTISIIELWVQEDWDWVRKEEIEKKWNKQLQGLKEGE